MNKKMITLTITQDIATQEDLNYLAISLWYKTEIETEVVAEMLVSEANEQWLTIKEVLEDNTKCMAIISNEMIPNSETSKEFVEKYFATKNKAEWVNAVLSLRKKELEEKRALEDKAIQDEINSKII